MKHSLKQKLTVTGRYDAQITSPLFTQAKSDCVEQTFIQEFADSLPQLIWLISKQNFQYYNQVMIDYLGNALNSHDPEHWFVFIHPDEQNCFQTLWQNAQKQQQSFEYTCRIRQAQFGYRSCKIQVQYKAASSTLLKWLISISDIHDHVTQQNELAQQILAQNKMLNASVDCIKILTPEGNVTHMNRSGCLALGVPLDDKKFGMPWLELLSEEVRPAGRQALLRAMNGHTARFSGISLLDEQDPQHWDNILTPITNDVGQTENILCVSRDISQQKVIEGRLQQVIELDDLTGLYSRRAFSKIFKNVLQKARQNKQKMGLLIIDLDHFKHVNDTLGHIAGDHLLHVLGQRFQNCFNKRITVARLGGDEFSILIQNLKDEAELIGIAEIACQQLELPISYMGQYINGGMSVGCSMYPRDAQSSSNLLKCADIALNDLKSSGRGGIRMFDQTMFKILEDTTKQLTLARTIIKANRIIPFYQPKVNLADGSVVGFEALLRWYDDEDRLQLPSHIFAAFQDYELASRISETMQLKVFEDMTQWQQSGLRILPISINAAPVEFLRDDYAEKLLERLAQFKIPHDMVELEITEQSLSERGANYVIRALTLLKESGIHISLDDFGTGHSSLTRLRDYPVDCIKIDRNFVERLTNDPSALAIVKAIAQIGSSISLEILVEGIENTEQLDVLRTCDCHIGQGFYFYRPMSFDSATPLLYS